MLNNYKIFKRIIVFISIATILFSNIVTFSAIVSDNDGSAFVTKSEFDALKTSFDKQIDDYNISIDGKIDGAIASYLAGVQLAKQIDTTSLLNNYTAKRRTFVNTISNPTTSGQSNLKITTNGFWVLVYLALGTEWRSGAAYYGYTFAGLNNGNYPNSGNHAKQPVEMSNGQSGQYLLTDVYNINGTKYPYFRENKQYLLTYMVRSFGSEFKDQCATSTINYGGPSSISWTNTEHRYNWTGTNNRTCGSGLSVPAVESLTLMKELKYTRNWIDNMCGSSIYTTNSGTLLNEDEYYWSYLMSNVSCGVTAQQSFLYKCYDPSYTSNSYNSPGSNPKINLNFYVPKITTYKGNEICVYDVMSVLNEPVYYFSGLPLCTMPAKGKLIVDANVVRNFASTADKTSTVTLAIKGSQFTNTNLSSETNCLFKKTYTVAELNTSTKVRIEIDAEKLEGLQNKNLWIKACASNTSDSVTLSTDAITCITEG